MTKKHRPAVLLDRDGVINRAFDRGGVLRPPSCMEEFEILPGVIEATCLLADAGWPMVVVTNQPDVARGMQTRAMVEEINRQIVKQLPVLEVLTCFHDDGQGCICRKPKPGLLLEAARRWSFDLSRSIMVGDRWSDVEAGKAAGCTSILVETPYSDTSRCRPDARVTDLAEAAKWISERGVGRGMRGEIKPAHSALRT
jgi:D-glycero-D-manno-heptose 1,7-bisphosphate phosphatase